MNNLKPERFLDFLYSYKMHLLVLLGLIRAKLTRFPTLSYASTGEIPTLSYTYSHKRYPFLA